MECAWFIDTLIGMSAKEIALGLDQIGQRAFATIAVIVGEADTNGGDRNAQTDRRLHDLVPRR